MTADDLRGAGLLPGLPPGPGGKPMGSLYAVCSTVPARPQSFSLSRGLTVQPCIWPGSSAWLSASLGSCRCMYANKACCLWPARSAAVTHCFPFAGPHMTVLQWALLHVGCPAPSSVAACNVVNGFNSWSLQRPKKLARVPRPSLLPAAGCVPPLLHRSLQPLSHSRRQAQPRERAPWRPPPSLWPVCWLRHLFRSC